MATKTLSIPLLVGGGSTLTGPAVDIGDTITLTVTAAGSSGTAASNSASGCNTVGNITLGTATANAVTNFSGTSYSFQFTHTDTNTTVYFRNVSGTINSASDTEVDSLSFGANVTGANLDSITYRSDQITGINQAVTFSKTSGDSGFEWQVTSSATTPTSGWGTSSVSVSNNQYVHLKMTASSSYSTARSATFSIGSPAKTDTISTTTKAASSPSAFNLGDTASTTAGSSYNSNTITLAGLDTGQSVTVSISSDASTYGYYKNGTLVANAANTTGANGDEFYVSHVAKTGNGTVTSTSLTAGGTSDTFTTTNSSSGGGTGWFVSKGSPSGTPNEGDLIGMSINAPLGQDENFWWSVSPTDVNASTGSGTTSYNTATKGVPAYNIGGFNFTPNVDYTDDDAAGTGPYNYTVNVYDNSARTSLVATTTVAVNDTSQPLPPDAAINAIGNQTLAYAAGSDNGHSITIGGAADNNSYYDVVVNGTTTPVYGTEIGNGTLEVADDNIAPGNQTTFRVYARRPTANNGDNSYYDTSRTYTISRKAQTPSISAALASNPNDDDVTINWTISNGDGGTLQYSTDNVTWTNGSSFAQASKRGTAYTLYARTNATVVSDTASGSFTPGYNAPDAAISAIASPDLAYGSTTHVVAIAGGSSIDEYFVYNNAGTVSYGDRTGDGDITITHGVAAGGAATFRVYVRRPLDVGGDNAFDDTGTTFEVEVYPQTPTASVAFDNPDDNDVTATVTASNTTGADSLAYSNGGTYVAGNTFAAVRGTASNYFVQSTGANGLTATGGTSGTPGYNAPDAAISAIASPDLAYGSTTHVVAIAGGSSIDEYYVYDNAGTVSYGGRTGNGDITITHGVAAGGAATFRVYARRPIAVGGDNAFDDTGTTFEVEVYPNNVVLSVSNDNPSAASVTATLSATGGQGGTIEYAKTSYSATTTYAQDRGTTVTYYARSVGSNGLISQVNSVDHTVGYIAPATYTRADFTVQPDTSQHFDVLTSFPVNDNYEVLTGGYTGTVRGSQSGGGGSNSIIAVNNINTPGTDVTYYIRGYRATSVGGDGLYDNMDTYVVGELPQASTVLETFTDLGTESTSGTFTVKVTPGTGASSVEISLTNSSTNLQNNDTDLANVVRAGDRIYTRTTAANGTVNDSFLDTPATYLAPNTGSIAGTSSTIEPTATTGSTTVSGVLSGHTYVVKKNNGDNDKPRSAIFTANGALTISDNGVASPPGLPLLGETFFYEFLVYRNTSAGGAGAPAIDDDWVETNRQFNIKRAPDAPTNILISVPATQSDTTSVFLNAIGGTAGGTVQVSDDNVNWFANNSEFQNKTRGTSYTFYARRLGTNNVTSDLYTHPAYEIPYIDPDPSVTATNDTIAFDDTSASTTVGDVNTNNNYAVRLNNGSTNLGTVDSSVTSPAVITFSSSLPSVGNTTTYEIFAARRVDTGGSGIYVATNDTFTVTRLVEPVTIPTDLVMSTAATASSTPLVTATASGGSGGTLQVSHDNVNWYTNGSTFTRTRGTAYTFYARRVGSGSVTASYSEGYTPPYLAPDAVITLTEGSSLLIGSSDTSFVLTIASGNSNDQYQVRDSAGTQHESRTGNGGITVTDVPSGGSELYTIFAKRPTSTGGDDTYLTTGTSITVTQQSGSGIVPPVIQSISNDNPNSSNVTATVNLTSPGSGGTLNYAQTTGNSVPSSGWGTGNTFSHPRNTTRYYWASQSTNTAGAYDSASHFVGSYSASVYGTQVFNASGNLTLDISDRVSGIVSRGSFSVTTGTTNVGGQVPQYEGTSSAISFTGMTTTNDDEFEVWISGNIPTAQFGLTNFVINRGTNSYTVTYRSYTASQTISAPYFNVRY